MSVQVVSPLRSRASRKPWPQEPGVTLFRCEACGRLYQIFQDDLPQQNPLCCSITTKQLVPQPVQTATSSLRFDYKIVGGFNANAVQVFWETTSAFVKPEWFMLRTFTGWYIKFVTPEKKSPVVFPLSDEDAYVYCDREECIRCVFSCKKGFVLYAYCENTMIEMPMGKVSDYFVTKAS